MKAESVRNYNMHILYSGVLLRCIYLFLFFTSKRPRPTHSLDGKMFASPKTTIPAVWLIEHSYNFSSEATHIHFHKYAQINTHSYTKTTQGFCRDKKVPSACNNLQNKTAC